MERSEIPLGVFAGYASTPTRHRNNKAIQIRHMLRTAYDPAKDYWKQPREAIRRSAAGGAIKSGLARTRFTSTDPSRIRNYEKAMEALLFWWTPYADSAVGHGESAVVSVEPFDIKVSPDLEFIFGGLRYRVRVRFTKGSQLLSPERVVTTSLIWEAFQDSMPAILDLETGEFSSRQGSDRELLEKVAADLASRWPAD